MGRGSVTRLAVVALVAGLVTLLPAAARAASTTSTWHMDETSGSTMADSTGSHPGKITGVGLGVAGDPSYPGTAYHFNGSSSKVTVPNSSSLNPQGSDLHIALSLRTTSVPASPDFDLARKGAFPQQEFKVELQPSGQVSCEMVGSSGGVVVLGKPDVHDGAWHRVQCDKTSSSVQITVDGTTTTSKKSVGSISNPADLIIGSHGTSEFFPGDIDEVSYTVGAGTSVPGAPKASFTATPSSGQAPLLVTFQDTSTGAPTAWAWDFGDGATSTAQSPTHTYGAPGSYTATLTATNAGGTTSATKSFSVSAPAAPPPDTRAPTGSFAVTPSVGWTRYTGVVLSQTGLADDATAVGAIRRSVDWKDGHGPVAWPAGTTTSHAYTAPGSYAPTVTLTDQAGNSAVVATGQVTIRTDGTAPSAGLVRPAHRSSAAAWRTLTGRVADAGTGVSFVHVRVVEKRGNAWYAYRPATHSWVKAPSKAAALRKSRAGAAVLSGSGRWTFTLPGVRRGTLVVRVVAGDHVRNTSHVLTWSQHLTHP
ncbi:PKD domain-containing protein [Nocardioides panacis]|uniref:PKD domain-containing protein n=1 Tax=Nocardioides panacis TaxID=2849501 RepID=A0A975XYI4_9ACTN|nr:PKD domain-containing protein [Nocardioides panacis]QWZ06426.1 PKD domain-containing protein [Nocardioides panacis]